MLQPEPELPISRGVRQQRRIGPGQIMPRKNLVQPGAIIDRPARNMPTRFQGERRGAFIKVMCERQRALVRNIVQVAIAMLKAPAEPVRLISFRPKPVLNTSRNNSDEFAHVRPRPAFGLHRSGNHCGDDRDAMRQSAHQCANSTGTALWERI